MRRITTITLALTMLAFCAPALFSQSRHTANTLKLDDPGNRLRVPVEKLDWLAGSWKGEGLGGVVEEQWSAASAGSLIGTFKLSSEGEPSFYEIFVISDDGDGVALKLKHFNPDMTGWEEKDDFVTFPLVKLGEREAYFGGLTYRSPSPDKLLIFLAMRRGGKLEEVEFSFDRVSFSGGENPE